VWLIGVGLGRQVQRQGGEGVSVHGGGGPVELNLGIPELVQYVMSASESSMAASSSGSETETGAGFS
jgi:hypothetical protein